MAETVFIPGTDTARSFRDALGCFGTGVTVVTTQTDDGPMGITVNSYTSVSLDPPLVLWCPSKGSERFDAFVSATHFVIHVMAQEQHAIAEHFAARPDGFDQFDWSANDEGQPVLSGCLARFECAHATCHDGGDHEIIVGRVLRAAHRPGKGLIFKRGQYGEFLSQP